MFEKIKSNEIKNNLAEAGLNLGIVAMTGAMVLSLADHAGMKQPALVTATAEVTQAGEHAGTGHDIRSQREETGPHRIDFGVPRNTPPRSGRA